MKFVDKHNYSKTYVRGGKRLAEEVCEANGNVSLEKLFEAIGHLPLLQDRVVRKFYGIGVRKTSIKRIAKDLKITEKAVIKELSIAETSLAKAKFEA